MSLIVNYSVKSIKSASRGIQSQEMNLTMARSNAVRFACLVVASTLSVCATLAPAQHTSPKIEVDLAGVSEAGLRGPPTGLRAVHYEFCIPAEERYATEVLDIDPTLQVLPKSRGRIGCTNRQLLAVGSTHQQGYREVLERLAALPYITRIVESFFE